MPQKPQYAASNKMQMLNSHELQSEVPATGEHNGEAFVTN